MGTESGLTLQTITQRIIEAARLAASMHLFESLRHKSQHYGRRVGIGGAGPVTPGDAEDSRLPNCPTRDATVTDDAPHAPQPTTAADKSYTRRPPRYSPAD